MSYWKVIDTEFHDCEKTRTALLLTNLNKDMLYTEHPSALQLFRVFCIIIIISGYLINLQVPLKAGIKT